MNVDDIVVRRDEQSYVQRVLRIVRINGQYATVSPEGETYSNAMKLDMLRLATPDEITASRAFAHALQRAWRAQEAMRDARLTIPWGMQIANVPNGVARIEDRIALLRDALEEAATAWRAAVRALDTCETDKSEG